MRLTNATHGPNRCAQHADQMNLAEIFLSVTILVSNAGSFNNAYACYHVMQGSLIGLNKRIARGGSGGGGGGTASIRPRPNVLQACM